MLRPERLLASLSYFRLLKTKVYQLMRPPPPPCAPAIVFTLKKLTVHQHIHQQLQQQLQQKLQHHIIPNQQARLLKAIQERFPIVNVFASPALRPVPAFQATCFFSRGTHQPFQLRTIIYSPTTFPRTAFVGYGSPGFARNFSSAKASFLNTNAGVGSTVNGPNIFAQYSTRTFAVAPKASLVSQPAGSSNQSASLKVGRVDGESEQDTKPEQHAGCNPAKPGYKIFSTGSKGIFEGLLCTDKSDIRARKPRLVRRVTAILRTAAEKKTKPDSADPVAQSQSEDSQPRSIAADISEAMGDIFVDPHIVASGPPDRALRSNTKRKKTGAGTTHISIQLNVPSIASIADVDAFVPSSEAFSTSRHGSLSSAQHLNTSLIRGVEDVAEMYQAHFRAVAHLLRTLKQYGEFDVVVVGYEMKVLFPPRRIVAGMGIESWDREGVEQWLKSVGIEPESPYFAIQTAADEEEEVQDEASIFSQKTLVSTAPDRHSTLFDTSEDSDDDLVVVPSLDASIISASTLHFPTLNTELGPEYFRELQEFLDNVDALIETSPAFGGRSGSVEVEEEFVRI